MQQTLEIRTEADLFDFEGGAIACPTNIYTYIHRVGLRRCGVQLRTILVGLIHTQPDVAHDLLDSTKPSNLCQHGKRMLKGDEDDSKFSGWVSNTVTSFLKGK